MYLEGSTGKSFAGDVTQYATLIPTIYNADTLGIRPDLIGRPITSSENIGESLNKIFQSIHWVKKS